MLQEGRHLERARDFLSSVLEFVPIQAKAAPRGVLGSSFRIEPSSSKMSDYGRKKEDCKGMKTSRNKVHTVRMNHSYQYKISFCSLNLL